MRYELTHDSIALQVFQKSSVEAHTRRKIERYIREHHAAHLQRGIFLDEDDLEYIAPYLNAVNLSAAEARFIDKSRARLRAQRRRRRAIIAAILLGVLGAGGTIYAKSMQADLQAQTAEQARQNEEAARLHAAEQTELRQEADQARRQTELAMDTVRIAREEAEREAVRARRAEAEAQQFRRDAETAQEKLAAANYSFMDDLLTDAESNIVVTEYGQAFGHLNTAVNFGQGARERNIEQNLPADWRQRANSSLFDLAYYHNESGNPEWVLEHLSVLYPEPSVAPEPLRRIRVFQDSTAELETFQEAITAIAADDPYPIRSRRILDTAQRIDRVGQDSLAAIERRDLHPEITRQLVEAERDRIKRQLYEATVADVRAATPGIIKTCLAQEAPERMRRLAMRYYPRANESFAIPGEAVGEDRDYDLAPLTAPIEPASFELFCAQTGRRFTNLATIEPSWRNPPPVVSTSWTAGARYANWLSRHHGLDTLYLFDAQDGVRLNPAAKSGYRYPTTSEMKYLENKPDYKINGWCQDQLSDRRYAKTRDYFRLAEESAHVPLWLVRSGFVTARPDFVPFTLLPISLYFEIDHPNPGTMRVTTDVTYLESVEDYYSRKEAVINEATQGLSPEAAFIVAEGLDDFYENDIQGGSFELLQLIENMELALRAGYRLSLRMTCYDPTRGQSNDYMFRLSQRRMSSIKNSFRAEGLTPYIENGQLELITEIVSPEIANSFVPTSLLSRARSSLVSITAINVIR